MTTPLKFKVIRARRHRFAFRTYAARLSQLLGQLSRNSAQTVIASGKFSIWAAGLAKFLFPRNRYIAILHGSEIVLNNNWQTRLTRFCLSRMDQLIAVSEFTSRLAQQLHPQLSPQVIHNGFKPPAETHATLADAVIVGNPALITVGNLNRRKGQHNVINALPGILKKWPNAHYHMVGIPTDKVLLEQQARELGVEKAISFHGIITDQELSAVLKKAQVFLMLSDRLPNGDVEGFGIAILEANYFGVPAIGSSDSGIAEAIKDGFSGYVVDQHAPSNIIFALENILNKYETFSKNARLWSGNFAWQEVSKKYLKAITPPN